MSVTQSADLSPEGLNTTNSSGPQRLLRPRAGCCLIDQCSMRAAIDQWLISCPRRRRRGPGGHRRAVVDPRGLRTRLRAGRARDGHAVGRLQGRHGDSRGVARRQLTAAGTAHRVGLGVGEVGLHLVGDGARSDFMDASTAFLRWFRKTGMAMAARMPMMMMTTRSSIRVKPWSFSSIDLRMRASMLRVPLRNGAVSLAAGPPSRAPVWVPAEAAGLTCTPAGPLALRPRLATGVPFLAVRLDDTDGFGHAGAGDLSGEPSQARVHPDAVRRAAGHERRRPGARGAPAPAVAGRGSTCYLIRSKILKIGM